MIMLLLMSSVYMSYSAYYFSFGGFDTLRTITELTINFLYILLGFLVVRNSLMAVESLREHLNQLPNANSPLQESITLKVNMMRGFFMLGTLIFAYEIFMHAILPIFMPTDENASVTIMHQSYEYFLILGLLWNFRPREWPEYFNLEVANLSDNNSYVPPKLAPIETAEIQFASGSSDTSFSSCSTTRPVVIVDSEKQIFIGYKQKGFKKD